jgi:uncharacterized protein involved in tolerance to divalent cations
MKDRKILCITRHSLRGANVLYNSQTVKILDDLIMPCPFIAWSLNLSTYGKDLVNIKIIEDVLKQNKIDCDKKKFWNEIRVDLTDQRTFETGKLIRRQIKEQKKYEVPVTAVLDVSDENTIYDYTDYDSVTSYVNNIPQKPYDLNLRIFETKTKAFLDLLNLSINDSPFKGNIPPIYDDNRNINLFYTNNIYAAIDLITMLAYNKSSLNQLYNNNKKYKHQYELITSGLAWSRYYYSNRYSKQYYAYSSLPIIKYLNQMDYGSNKIIVTHDENQLQLLASLEILSFKYDIPFQSYIIIQTKTKIKILYVAPKLSRETCTFQRNKCIKKLIWKGSIDEWNQKIAKMQTYIVPEYSELEVKPAYSLNVLNLDI